MKKRTSENRTTENRISQGPAVPRYYLNDLNKDVKLVHLLIKHDIVSGRKHAE